MSRRRTVKTLNKPPPIQSVPKKTTFDGDQDIQFELELCWCVQQLQTALDSGKLNPKTSEDTLKNLKTLTSKTAPIIKKRQVMKLSLGDYRSKMEKEEKSMLLASRQIKFTPAAAAAATDGNKKSSFVKKSAILTSGKDFRFNFDHCAEATTTTPTSTASTSVESTQLKSSILNGGNGSPFKFNFEIEDDSADGINVAGLALK